MLFGSWARGDARRDSDYDVALFLKRMDDHRTERSRLADLRIRFIEDTEAFIDAQPFPAAAYRERTPLKREMRRSGLTLCGRRPSFSSTRVRRCSAVRQRGTGGVVRRRLTGLGQGTALKSVKRQRPDLRSPGLCRGWRRTCGLAPGDAPIRLNPIGRSRS